MTPQEAIAYIDNFTWSTTRLGLSRTRELLSAMGDPQKKLRFIHVAGSNGKGSTCAMLAAILQRAGYKTGLYTSPFIEEFGERMQVNGENIPGEALASITERVRVLADAMEDHPSQFELVTAVAMQYFYEAHCDIVVLEVGMGGELDSTNVIDCPDVAVITNIGLEHTEYLGNTLTEIAQTKAGIIKEGCRVVLYDGEPEVRDVVRRVCAEKHAGLLETDFSKLVPGTQSLDGQTFTYEGAPYQVALLGPHQLHNAVVVLETVRTLRELGWAVPEDAVHEGLRTVSWPARLEVLNREPLFILDGGHNPQCAEALADALSEILPKDPATGNPQKAVFLAGVLADKDYNAMLDFVAPFARAFICTTPQSNRALPAADFAKAVEAKGIPATPFEDIPEALLHALLEAGEDGAVVSFGSLYQAGAVRSAYKDALRKFWRKTRMAAREALSDEERREKSDAILDRILELPEFRNAKTVMIYNSVGGEVQLERLPAAASAAADANPSDAADLAGKRYVYPLCVSETELEAYSPKAADRPSAAPENAGSFKPGAFGIPEPDPAACDKADPEDIDLVLCPLTAFDEQCSRIGMGAGYYDRYLQRCKNAAVIGVAFDIQKVSAVPAEPWDQPMTQILTERQIYRFDA